MYHLLLDFDRWVCVSNCEGNRSEQVDVEVLPARSSLLAVSSLHKSSSSSPCGPMNIDPFRRLWWCCSHDSTSAECFKKMSADTVQRAVSAMALAPAARMLEALQPPKGSDVLLKLDPASAAKILQAAQTACAVACLAALTGRGGGNLLNHMDAQAASGALEDMDAATAAKLLQDMQPELAAKVVRKMDAGCAASALAAMDHKLAAAVLVHAPPKVGRGRTSRRARLGWGAKARVCA